VNSLSDEILAKPDGTTLAKHTTNVVSEAKKIENVQSFVFQKYEKHVGKSLSIRLEKTCEDHDLGKADERWQIPCQKDYETYVIWKEKNHGSFNDYAKASQFKAGENLRKAGIRHELQSLKRTHHKKSPLAIKAAIAAHHSKLSERHEERWEKEGHYDLWKYFKIESANIRDQHSFELALQRQYEVAGPRSLLQFADRRASAMEGGDYVPPLVKFSYKFPWPSKRRVQKLIQDHWKEKFLLVRAPTGAGKTDAALLWASLQIENNRADRLIVAMPTRFTSNALAINVAESLSDTGLYHSSAWFNKYKDKVEKAEISRKEANKHHEFARLLQTPITVCTIDHLLIALTLAREDHHQITFNLANACLVIDEADFYDDFTQANINVLLVALKQWDVPVLLMSASLPQNVLVDFKKTGCDAKEIIEDTSDSERKRFKLQSIQENSSLADIEHLLENCIKAGAAIIYANTVDRAIAFYDYFKNREVEAMVYHSRFTEPHKKDKEEALIKALGREAWEKKEAQGIAILTQIGEMSINISADLMISDLCPIDRLIQRTGRLCRFDNDKIGELHLLIPQKNGALYPAPYGQYDRKEKRWNPVEAFIKTLETLELKSYSANNLLYLMNQIYFENKKYSAKSLDNARKLKDSFISNWLINPMQNIASDDAETNNWQSRDIGPQDTLFIEKPDSTYFKNYFEFQSWKLDFTIDVPVYLIEKYRKKNMIEVLSIVIGDEEEIILLVREGFYNFTVGIADLQIDDQYL
jgi:CRISPR-associated endonuclease/helicase Cas3